MTCIVAIKTPKSIFMGADSAGVGGSGLSIIKDSKVFIKNKFIIGYTSSFRMGQLLRYKIKFPTQNKTQDIFTYMATNFVDALRKCYEDSGFLTKKDSSESGGSFLIGYKGRLFQIQEDFAILETICNYQACGCGKDIALGSLYSTDHEHLEDCLLPSYRLELALQAAEQFSTSVRSPFNVLEMKSKET